MLINVFFYLEKDIKYWQRFESILFPVIMIVNLLETPVLLALPPYLTDWSLLTVEIGESGVRHIVSIVDEVEPLQHLVSSDVMLDQVPGHLTLAMSYPPERDLYVEM